MTDFVKIKNDIYRTDIVRMISSIIDHEKKIYQMVVFYDGEYNQKYTSYSYETSEELEANIIYVSHLLNIEY